MEKCFCHLNGYTVKDATARAEIEALKANAGGGSSPWRRVTGNIVINEEANKIFCVEIRVANSICGFMLKINGTNVYAQVNSEAKTFGYHYIKMYLTGGQPGLLGDCYKYYGDGDLCGWQYHGDGQDAPTKTIQVIDESGGEAGNVFYYRITEIEVEQ